MADGGEGTLDAIAHTREGVRLPIDAHGLDPRLFAVSLSIMCDVDNPLLGPQGATQVFGPQKGADAATIA